MKHPDITPVEIVAPGSKARLKTLRFLPLSFGLWFLGLAVILPKLDQPFVATLAVTIVTGLIMFCLGILGALVRRGLRKSRDQEAAGSEANPS